MVNHSWVIDGYLLNLFSMTTKTALPNQIILRDLITGGERFLLSFFYLFELTTREKGIPVT